MSLRSGRVPTPQTSNMDSTRPNSSIPSRSSPARPSPYLLIVYPIILALGSAFSTISPIANIHTLPYSSAQSQVLGTTSGQTVPTHPLHQLNYFAGKRNFLNVYFVKIGWFWTTLAFVLLQLTVRTVALKRRSPNTATRSTQYIQAFLRYAIATAVWISVTQWFFGPPIVDRSFALTGGHCESSTIPTNMTIDEETTRKINKLPKLFSAVACKAAGGHWRGGHDISGHVFLLVLSSAFLLYELHISDLRSGHPSISPQAAANISHDMTEEEKKAVGGWETETAAKIRVWTRRFVYTVIGLDFWMLMMTAIWFHTWLEKLSGLFIAGCTVYTVYFLGEFVPAWEGIIGGFSG